MFLLHKLIVTPLSDVIESVQEANRPQSPVPGSQEWSFVEQPLDIVRVIYIFEVMTFQCNDTVR